MRDRIEQRLRKIFGNDVKRESGLVVWKIKVNPKVTYSQFAAEITEDFGKDDRSKTANIGSRYL